MLWQGRAAIVTHAKPHPGPRRLQVLRCFDHKMGCDVAVKIIRNKKRFHHQALVEVKILEHLRHKVSALLCCETVCPGIAGIALRLPEARLHTFGVRSFLALTSGQSSWPSAGSSMPETLCNL